MKIRIHINQPLIPLITAFLLGLQLMNPSRVWMMMLVVFGGAWLAAHLWVLVIARNIHLRRETRVGWVQVGGQIEERFTLSNVSLLPAFRVEIKDKSTLPGYNASASFSLDAGALKQWSVSAACNRRGIYTLGGAAIEAGDPFDIYTVSIHDPAQTSLIVLPQIVSLPNFDIRPAGFNGDGLPRPNAPEQIMSVSSVREYRAGDAMRLIHWRTTARQKEIYVRLMEGAPEGKWWILLDLDKRTMHGDGWDSIEEQSVTLAASLADLGLAARKSVGLIASCESLIWLPPQNSEGQLWTMLEALASARPGNTELNKLLEQSLPVLGHHHCLIIITASPKTGWLKNILTARNQGITPTVFLLDPQSFGKESSIQPAENHLKHKGMGVHIIERGMLAQPLPKTDQTVSWKWRQTRTGQIMPVQIPESAAKRGL